MKERDMELLREAQDAWERLSEFRRGRERHKAFAFGRQWSDTVVTPEGRIVSEESLAAGRGKPVITNNLIRQMLKQVVGRWRYLREGDTDALEETDARALEEFLISGCAIQRIEGKEVRNVSPGMVFYHRFMEADGRDCVMMGMLHDMRIGEVLGRFSGGRAEIVRAICREAGDFSLRSLHDTGEGTFEYSGLRGRIRIIEVWKRKTVALMLIHDRETGEYRKEEYTEDGYDELLRMNKERGESGKGRIGIRLQLKERWEQTWMTAKGQVLGRKKDGDFPFVMRFYPMIDGEVHSLVEDVIGQQKYVNRLVMLLDDVVASAAKGVLLYPTDQLPEGLTWRELRRVWENPRGVIPFRRTSKNVMPQQITTPGTSAGASEMLRMQLDLFDEIAGVSSTLRGSRGASAGAETLRLELEQSTIAMLDLLKVFDRFREERNKRIRN